MANCHRKPHTMTTGASLISLQTYRLPVLATSVTCHPMTVTGNRDEQAVENKHLRFLQKPPSLFRFISYLFIYLFVSSYFGWMFLHRLPVYSIRLRTDAHGNKHTRASTKNASSSILLSQRSHQASFLFFFLS